MFSRFFIDRPIFATVISIVITLAGGVAVFNLPVAQYPDVTPPTVQVTAIYPGANAYTLRDTVASPRLNGAPSPPVRPRTITRPFSGSRKFS